MSYILFCRLLSGFRIFDPIAKEFKTINKYPSEHHSFELMKGYKPTDEDLKRYAEDFKKWCDELKDPENFLTIDYSNYVSHSYAVRNTYKRLKKNKFKNVEDIKFSKIGKTEHHYFSMCNNGPLMYCQKYEGPSYGYDYKQYYPTILAAKTFQVPTKKGKAMALDTEKIISDGENLPYGFYFVGITSKNPNAKKIFSFSKKDLYTHYSVQFAWKYKDTFNFEFEFYDKDQNNCYVYDEADLVPGSLVFGNWKNKLTKLRKKYPKNKLLKHLLSSAWGQFTGYKAIYKTYSDIKKEGLDVGPTLKSEYVVLDHHKTPTEDYYKLYSAKDPYKMGEARIKSFMSSFARIRIAETAIYGGIDDVIRIHTDNVTFKCNKDEKMKNRDIKPEDKTTGNLKWTRINEPPERLGET